jgi:hypothetical protein
MNDSRRKFVWGIAVVSACTSLAAFAGKFLPGRKNIISCEPENKKKMVKMLTQDGQLVEIDESLIAAKGKKISTGELQNWVKK